MALFILLRRSAFVLLLGAAGATRAQAPPPAPVKFGQPDANDFKPETFATDSAAGAVVLCD